MTIEFMPFISRDLVRANPDRIFVFGDNSARCGLGGQAGAMRGEPNSIGVATKRKPSMSADSFFSDGSTLDRAVLEADLHRVKTAIDAGKTIVVPQDGLGTGLSELPQRAPGLYKTLYSFFMIESLNHRNFPWPHPYSFKTDVRAGLDIGALYDTRNPNVRI